ncbi:hypothetical protein Hdeb2414_s1146g00985511 [Helianthus debilis subsp. tardiflorus]
MIELDCSVWGTSPGWPGAATRLQPPPPPPPGTLRLPLDVSAGPLLSFFFILTHTVHILFCYRFFITETY